MPPASAAEELSELYLALFEGARPKVVAVQPDEVEGEQDGHVVVALGIRISLVLRQMAAAQILQLFACAELNRRGPATSNGGSL
jgi:hypothetical protein